MGGGDDGGQQRQGDQPGGDGQPQQQQGVVRFANGHRHGRVFGVVADINLFRLVGGTHTIAKVVGDRDLLDA